MQWDELPDPLAPRPKYRSQALELKAHPGKWGVLATAPKSRGRSLQNIATRINAGRMVSFAAVGHFEAKVRFLQDGTVRLYVRFTGLQPLQSFSGQIRLPGGLQEGYGK